MPSINNSTKQTIRELQMAHKEGHNVPGPWKMRVDGEWEVVDLTLV